MSMNEDFPSNIPSKTRRNAAKLGMTGQQYGDGVMRLPPSSR